MGSTNHLLRRGLFLVGVEMVGFSVSVSNSNFLLSPDDLHK